MNPSSRFGHYYPLEHTRKEYKKEGDKEEEKKKVNVEKKKGRKLKVEKRKRKKGDDEE